ncbi:MAG TPA: amino acid racemase [Nitrospira sp.]|nr:amino acid racemase [Nitrospira sp.]
MTARHIGITAGTAEGTALCYRMLTQRMESLLSPELQPHVTIHAVPQSWYLSLIDQGDWIGVASLMSQSAAVLARAGADTIICPNNTLHHAFDLVVSTVPWLHIAEVVASEARRHGYRRVGLLGTQIVMEGSMYQSKLGQRDIDTLIPDERERDQIQHIIRTELIPGRFTDRSRSSLLQILVEMANKGADAAILACTELPLLLTEELSPLPLLDSTRLLAQAALTRAVSSDEPLSIEPRIVVSRSSTCNSNGGS